MDNNLNYYLESLNMGFVKHHQINPNYLILKEIINNYLLVPINTKLIDKNKEINNIIKFNEYLIEIFKEIKSYNPIENIQYIKYDTEKSIYQNSDILNDVINEEILLIPTNEVYNYLPKSQIQHWVKEINGEITYIDFYDNKTHTINFRNNIIDRTSVIGDAGGPRKPRGLFCCWLNDKDNKKFMSFDLFFGGAFDYMCLLRYNDVLLIGRLPIFSDFDYKMENNAALASNSPFYLYWLKSKLVSGDIEFFIPGSPMGPMVLRITKLEMNCLFEKR